MEWVGCLLRSCRVIEIVLSTYWYSRLKTRDFQNPKWQLVQESRVCTAVNPCVVRVLLYRTERFPGVPVIEFGLLCKEYFSTKHDYLLYLVQGHQNCDGCICCWTKFYCGLLGCLRNSAIKISLVEYCSQWPPAQVRI